MAESIVKWDTFGALVSHIKLHKSLTPHDLVEMELQKATFRTAPNYCVEQSKIIDARRRNLREIVAFSFLFFLPFSSQIPSTRAYYFEQIHSKKSGPGDGLLARPDVSRQSHESIVRREYQPGLRSSRLAINLVVSLHLLLLLRPLFMGTISE